MIIDTRNVELSENNFLNKEGNFLFRIEKFEEDGFTIGEIVRKTDFRTRAPIIFGTSWDRDLVKELQGYIIEISLPTSNEIVIK